MKFRVDRDVLAEAVAWTARTVPVRPAVPVLAGMLLQVGDDLELSSFDYDVSARTVVDVAADEPGTALVSGRLLAEITRSLPPEPVEVVTDGARVVIDCDGNRFTLMTLPVEEYPSLPEMPELAGIADADTFAAAVGQVTIAASRDDTLPMLTGVRLEVEGETVTMACTDRYRMAVREMPWQPTKPDISAGALVPAKTLADVARSMSAGEVSIALAGDGMMGFAAGTRRTTTRLLDEQFINYRARFPTEFSGRAELATASFIEAVKRVSLVAERNTPVRLAFSAGQVVLEAATGDEAQGKATLAADLTGDDILIAFNPQFLLDGLTAINAETTRLEFTTSAKASLITGRSSDDAEPDYRYLLMPIRLSS